MLVSPPVRCNLRNDGQIEDTITSITPSPRHTMIAPNSRNTPVAAAVLTAIASVALISFLPAASEKEKPLEEEKREVDELLSKVDSVELGKVSPRVLRLAERLLKEKGDAEALPYFQKGLEGNSWALEQQLTFGEIRSRMGQPDVLRERSEMVLRIGEDDEVLKRACRLIGRTLPDKPVPLSGISENARVLVLMPVGEGNMFLLPELRDGLSKRLGIKVIIAAHDVSIGKADRTFKSQWIKRTREQILKSITDRPALVSQVKQMGFTVEQLRTDEESVVAFVRKTAKMEHGASEAQAVDSMLAEMENSPQWDSSKLLLAMKAALGDRAGSKQLVLGVTECDLFAGTSNYLFGGALNSQFLGIVSSHRFRAAFNGEPPMRARLNERVLKQSLSSIGFMLGVPRCTTPECARAYPQSLLEHDRKPLTLCPACRAGIERVFGRKLPAD